MSSNSRFLAHLDAGQLYRYDLVAKTNQLVGSALGSPAISGDGRFIVGETTTGTRQVVVVDCVSGATNLVSANASGTGANRNSRTPVISADGRFIAFVTKATDLVPGATNGWPQIVLRDRVLGTSTLISSAMDGTAGDFVSGRPVFAANGRTLAFESMAGNLVPGDSNDRRDIFVLQLGAVDSDGDGMDDDWELAYFGSLSHDGTSDSDNDGVTDKNEFLAGTDPTNSGSVFQVMTVSRVGQGGKTILWKAAANRNYRVEYRDNLNSTTWTPLTSSISWTGDTASAIDNEDVPSRFYRVVRLP